MKNIKRITITLLFLTLLFGAIFSSNVKVKANYTYTENETEFRAAWISYYTGDIRYSDEEQYKKDINKILDTLEFYNMNAMIFHVRSNHDAWYNSKINKINSQLSNVDFDNFDPLEYVITEAHKRGIEFHAWLNPYRLGSSYKTKAEVTSAHSSYPSNPASKEENVLIGSPLQILDPGRPAVRSFLIDTCLELVENYQVDAIHFDDYFYAKGIDDSETINLYNKNNLSTSNFRRQQVDTFIKDLDIALDTFNKENNRFVQLGIAPTGVYKNANSTSEANTPLENYRYDSNGNLTYPIGATTGCQMHYESYLYCDTLKWVNNEWIDYIIPQTYWSTTHNRAPFEQLINWWNMAVKNKKVNLYAGMGIYMWMDTNTGDAYKQVSITSNLEHTLGTSIYSFGEIADAYSGADYDANQQMKQLKQDAWKNKIILPEVNTFERVNPGNVKDLIVKDNTLSFTALDDAKFYIIYRDKESINYENDQIVDIIGSEEEYIVWKDNVTGNYVYDVVPLSYTNTLGEPTIQLIEDTNPNINATISLNSDGSNKLAISRAYNIEFGQTAYVFLENDAPDTSRLIYNWTTSDKSIVEISEYGTITTIGVGTAKITGTYKNDPTKFCDFYINVYSGDISNQKFSVKFIDPDGTVLKTETVVYGGYATPPTEVTKEPTQKYEYIFAGWSKIYSNITCDMTIQAIYDTKLQKYEVTYKNADGSILKTEKVEYGHPSTPPLYPKLEPTIEYTFIFTGWDKEYSSITEDTVITAQYRKQDNLYQLNYETNGGTQISTEMYFHDEYVYEPINCIKEGYVIEGWYFDSDFSEKCVFPFKLTKNTTIFAKWILPKTQYNVNFYSNSGVLIKTQKVNENEFAVNTEAQEIPGFIFVSWALRVNNNLEKFDFNTPITSNLDLYPIYQLIVPTYIVNFYDANGKLIHSEVVEENSSITGPKLNDIEEYRFIGWDENLENINSSLEVYPIYEKIEKEKNCTNCASSILQLILILGTIVFIFRKK